MSSQDSSAPRAPQAPVSEEHAGSRYRTAFLLAFVVLFVAMVGMMIIVGRYLLTAS